MKKDNIPDASAQAERLLECFFRSGPRHRFIFGVMQPLAPTKALLDAPRPVVVEIVRRLMALIEAVAKARQGTSMAACDSLVRQLVPGLASWDDEDSKWLPSGAERVPPQLVPLLLRKRLECSDATFAELIERCCAIRRPEYLLIYGKVVEGMVKQAVRRMDTDGLGEHSSKPLKRFGKVLDGVSRNEISALARWGKKLAASIREAQAREEE